MKLGARREQGYMIGHVIDHQLANAAHVALLNSITQQVFTLPEATRVFPGHGGETTVGYEKIHNRFLRDQPPTTC